MARGRPKEGVASGGCPVQTRPRHASEVLGDRLAHGVLDRFPRDAGARGRRPRRRRWGSGGRATGAATRRGPRRGASGGHQQHPHDERVDEDPEREGEPDRPDDRAVAEDEPAEDRDHDDRRGGDHRAAGPEAEDDGRAGGRAVGVRLAHARGQEQHVVHRQAEQDADEDRGQEVEDRRRGRDAEHGAEPAPLVDGDRAAERREVRQDEPAGRDERHEQRAEDDDHDHEATGRRPAAR